MERADAWLERAGADAKRAGSAGKRAGCTSERAGSAGKRAGYVEMLTPSPSPFPLIKMRSAAEHTNQSWFKIRERTIGRELG
ncbi:hypothetical protein [Sporosarcina gallistercoris]|uniref:Uncharacterized protein n=1 Tax=Sporosarcina gallistercoris TaxID=2762245 RepID=A0ABR8PKI5_9BACL|nr:hypothetical protein [Sporosarcina gallistercoris]MBD7908688.1 hypothetical protein [Sporosarcina gallistercoris]